MKAFLPEFRPDELREHVARKPLILIPIGAVEWHAAHLPLGVDGLLALAFCHALAAKTGTLVAPPVWSGVCRDLAPEAGYYGTIATISESTMEGLIADLLEGYSRLGFKAAVLFSAHFEMEHFGPIQRGMERATGITSRFITEITLIEDQVTELDNVEQTWPNAADHAGEFETSLMLHHYGGLVNMADAPETVELDMAGLPDYIRKRYPRRASADYGARLNEMIIAGGVKLIQELLELSLSAR